MKDSLIFNLTQNRLSRLEEKRLSIQKLELEATFISARIKTKALMCTKFYEDGFLEWFEDCIGIYGCMYIHTYICMYILHDFIAFIALTLHAFQKDIFYVKPAIFRFVQKPC